MNITILNVAVSTQPAKKPGGKPYQLAEVAFKNNTFGGKVDGKKITSYSKAFKAVAEATPGKTYEVVTEKNGEFVEWVSLSETGAGTPVVEGSKTDVGRGAYAGVANSTTRGNFETPEERAKKQVYIVRQSAISSAIAALSVGGKSALKAEDVLVLAKRFEKFVFDVGGDTGFDDIPDLDPSFTQDPQIE